MTVPLLLPPPWWLEMRYDYQAWAEARPASFRSLQAALDFALVRAHITGMRQRINRVGVPAVLAGPPKHVYVVRQYKAMRVADWEFFRNNPSYLRRRMDSDRQFVQ